MNPFLRWINRLYSIVIYAGSNLQSAFLLYLRVVWGHQLAVAGIDKLHNIQGTIEFFTSLNIPAPAFHAYNVAFFETVGGIFLILGLASRLISIPLIVIMFTALTTAHGEYLKDFRFISDPQLLVIQAPYPYLIASLVIFIFGPGRISLDAWLKRWLSNQPKY